jgi:hypothetical protein
MFSNVERYSLEGETQKAIEEWRLTEKTLRARLGYMDPPQTSISYRQPFRKRHVFEGITIDFTFEAEGPYFLWGHENLKESITKYFKEFLSESVVFTIDLIRQKQYKTRVYIILRYDFSPETQDSNKAHENLLKGYESIKPMLEHDFDGKRFNNVIHTITNTIENHIQDLKDNLSEQLEQSKEEVREHIKQGEGFVATLTRRDSLPCLVKTLPMPEFLSNNESRQKLFIDLIEKNFKRWIDPFHVSIDFGFTETPSMTIILEKRFTYGYGTD